MNDERSITIMQMANGWLVCLPVVFRGTGAVVDYTDPETIKKMARIMTDAVQEEKLLRELREANEVKPAARPKQNSKLPPAQESMFIFSHYSEVVDFLAALY